MAPCPAPGLLILACSATKRDGPSYMLAIERYRSQTWMRLLAAYQAASRECQNCPHPDSVAQLRQLVMQPRAVPGRLRPWLVESRLFHARYLQEQLTLAARSLGSVLTIGKSISVCATELM